MNEQNNTLTLGSVSISDVEIAEYDRNLPIVQIPKDDIVQIDLKRSIASERPIIQFLLGLIITIPGFNASRVIWHWLFFGGTLYIDIAFSFILLIPLGLWLSFSSLQKRILLEISTKKNKRKILFKKEHSIEEIRNYIAQVNEVHGYKVRDIIVAD